MVVWLATNGSGTAPWGVFFWAGGVRNNLGFLAPQVVGTGNLGDFINNAVDSDWLVFGLGAAPQPLYVQQIASYTVGTPVLIDTKVDWGASTPQIVPDGLGGVVAAYNDVLGLEMVRAERVMSDFSIAPLWASVATGGTMVATQAVGQFVAAIASDGNSGAIVLSHDNFVSGFVYCDRVDRWGALDGAPAIVSVRDVPSDQGGEVRLTWNASYLDLPYGGSVNSYWLWRQVPISSAQALLGAGAERYRPDSPETPRVGAIRIESPQRSGATTLSGITPAQVQSYAWEYLGSQVSDGFSQYSFTAATALDSTGPLNPRTIFMVEARNAQYNVGWPSLPDSGYSVDNLPPYAPAPFVGTYSAGTASLHWQAVNVPDLANYKLYRGGTSSFVPGPSNLIASPTDTAYVDPAGAPNYYRISAVDSHGNEGPSTLLLPSGTAGAGGSLPTEVSFAPPAPNPARGVAMLRYALPSDAVVRLAIYDVNGRRVRTLAEGSSTAGDHAVTWDVRDDGGRALGAGLYFARFEADGRVITRRLMTLK
jgi:hypothetical protein